MEPGIVVAKFCFDLSKKLIDIVDKVHQENEIQKIREKLDH